MTFDEYQQKALETAIFNKDPLMDKTIWAMGISGEAGEVLEKWKKIVAYKDGLVSQEDRDGLKKELGDVVWYIGCDGTFIRYETRRNYAGKRRKTCQ